MKKPIQIYLEEEHVKELKKMAIDRGQTLTEFVKNKLTLTSLENKDRGVKKAPQTAPTATAVPPMMGMPAKKILNMKPCPHGYAPEMCKFPSCRKK